MKLCKVKNRGVGRVEELDNNDVRPVRTSASQTSAYSMEKYQQVLISKKKFQSEGRSREREEAKEEEEAEEEEEEEEEEGKKKKRNKKEKNHENWDTSERVLRFM
ncbi:hypothetical protein HZH66_006556 [Vespula vulgaris]|uniref:Uncharacterized protein n=1 Tax=Vespula vulgaris TaxID=7454 RepID=A0A834N8D0_VESVU|nr:hypothetical protein HZH66_006556 [Vespula vulgaris]